MPSPSHRLLVAALLVLAGSWGCVENDFGPCAGLRTVGSFVDCDALCGSSTTAVRCDAGEGGLALSTIAELERWAWESTAPGSSSWDPYGIHLGCWRWSDLASKDAVELTNFPGGVPSTNPPVAARASRLPDGRVHLTQYVHATKVIDECVLRLGIAMSWTPIDMDILVIEENLAMSFIVLEANGDCPATAHEGATWKRTGWLLHPAPLHLPEFQDIACRVDGHCVAECRVDYDCPCARDEECNRLCLILDPDCPCQADECCSWECLSQDPDCGCGDDGICSAAPCGWFDPDCICGDDGLCNETCGDGKDPDCSEGR